MIDLTGPREQSLSRVAMRVLCSPITTHCSLTLEFALGLEKRLSLLVGVPCQRMDERRLDFTWSLS